MYVLTNYYIYRLPIIGCEILACEVQSLIDAIFTENKDILQKLWGFLNTPYSIEPEYSFQASYFCKIITTFLTKRTMDMLHFIQANPVDRLLSHLQSSAIMDLVLTLIRLEELPEAKGIVQVHKYTLITQEGLLYLPYFI